MDTLKRIGTDIELRLDSVFRKSNLIFKYFALSTIVTLAFFLRFTGFVRVRGRHDVKDIFNLGLSNNMAGTGVLNFFSEEKHAPAFPGFMIIANFIGTFLQSVGVPLNDQAIFTLIGPFFASCTVISTYFIGKELKDGITGIIAAGIVALLPGFYSISVDGSSANVVVGAFFATLVVNFFIRALREATVFNAALAGIAYFALSSVWCGYIFVQLFISAYVVTLISLGHCTKSKSEDGVALPDVYTTFTVFYIVGTALSVFLPVVGFTPFLYLDQFPGIAVFVLLQLHYHMNINALVKPLGGLLAIMFVGGIVLGVLKPSSGFSIALSQITSGEGSSWVTFFRDFHVILFLFPAGIFLIFRKQTFVRVFFTVYAGAAFLVSSFSVSFSPLLFPIAAVLAAFSVVWTFKSYLKHHNIPQRRKKAASPIGGEINVAVLAGIIVILGLFVVYSFSADTHPTVYAPTTLLASFSQTTNQFSWVDDLREAHSWISHNTPNNAKLVTWKGVGHTIAEFSRSAVLGKDTKSPQNVAEVAKIWQSGEEVAYYLTQKLGAEYVLVVFGGATGFKDDDVSHAHEISDESMSEESLLFKLSYKGFADTFAIPGKGPGFDVLRRSPINYRPELSHFEEVFCSEHWIIRIYRVQSKGEGDLNIE